MRIFDGKVYRDLTAEEIATREKEARLASIAEAARPLTENEVNRMLITAQINTLAVDDNTALRMRDFYPEWAAGVSYAAGYKVQHGSKLWRVREGQTHTSLVGWEPENAASLWEQINETHTGATDDPIPYSGNMALEEGKYYMQDYAVYYCVRATINPVYQPLGDLVGIYVTGG